RKGRFRVPLDERAQFLQLDDRARLQIGAVIIEKLIVRHPQFRAGTERTFLREQRIEVAETGCAVAVWSGAVAGKFREGIRPFDRRAGGEIGSGQSRLRPARGGRVRHEILFASGVWTLRKSLRSAPLDLVQD